MPLDVPRGCNLQYRFVKGKPIRIAGCMRKGRFTKILEVVNVNKRR